MLGVWPSAQVVQATPGFLAYHAPLTDGDPVRSGIGYWLPPGPRLQFAGAPERVRPLTAVLSFPVKETTVGTGERLAAMTTSYVAMLATLDWSVRKLRQQIALPARAAREAATVTAAMHSTAPPSRLGTSALLARVALRVLPLLVPFDLHAYLPAHFGKLSEQTGQMLDGWISEGHARSLPVDGLEAMRTRVVRNSSEHLKHDS